MKPRLVKHGATGRLVAAATLAVLGTGLVVAGPASATPQLTPLSTESFTGASTVSTGWSVPTRSSNGACLTAGTDTTQRPISACSSTALDAVGSGTLRLTSNVNSAVGTVYNTTSLPTTKGLDVLFNTYQYNSTTSPGADGIAFILAATDPSAPAPPSVKGPLGGSLGYSAAGSTQGVSYGYFGFGLDVFGNYRNSGFGGSGCSASSAAAQNITVRGPGNGTAGYCIAGTTQVSAGALDARLSTSRPTAVPVEIALNPDATSATAQGGFTVPAHGWAMRVTPIGGSAQTLTGSLPSAATLSGLGFPTAWVDQSTGLPYQLTFGWAASTGGNNEVHEINTLASQTLTGQLPVFQLALSDNESGTFLAGNHAVVSVTPSLDASQGSESNPPTVTTTFPTGITPAASFTSSGYSCSSSGQVATCTYTGSTPVSAGSTFGAINIPVTIPSGTSPANYTITSKVSSVDGNPAVASRTVAVTSLAASATPSSIAHGTTSTLAVTGLPASATGTVTFTSGATTLCTATRPASSCTTSSTLAVGSYAVTATYSGDGAFASQTATTSLTVTQATLSSMTASATPNSVDYGTTSTLAASGIPADATGTVSFDDGATHLCTATLPATTCPTSATLPAGTYSVTAHYSGDANYASRNAATSLTVDPAATSFTASPGATHVTYGTSNSLLEAGLPADATGTVTYTSGGDTLCVQHLPADSSCDVPATLPAGTYPVTATYSGDDNHDGSTATTTFDVDKATPSITASATDASVTYGTADTLVVSGLTVSGPTAATGTVTFTARGTTLCTATLPATSCSTSTSLPAGTYNVTATYNGDANHDGATDTTTFAVTKKSTSSGFTASATPASVEYGTADVLAWSGLPAGATGTVTFTAGGDTLCTATLPATSCSAPSTLAVDTYDVTATYSGDDNHDGTSTTTTFDVHTAPTSLTASVADASLAYGTAEVLSASGLPAGATGTVTFTVGGHTLCTATLPTTTCSASTTLDVDTYDVTASYSGDHNYDSSTATTAFEVVKRATALTAAVGSPSVAYGTRQQLSYAGLPTGTTGTVTFASGGHTLCTATLPATSCLAPGDLDVDTYPVTATYSGDGNNLGSSASTTFDVTRVVTTTEIPVPPATVDAGTPTRLQVTGVPSGATGTVTFTAFGKVLCVVTLPGRSCVTTGLAAGTYAVTATYSGDANHAGDSSSRTYTVAAVVPRTATSGEPQSVSLPDAAGAKKITITTPPAEGDARIVDGKLVYTPAAGFTGTETVTVTIVDADGTKHAVTYRFEVDATSTTRPGTGGNSTGSSPVTAATGASVLRLLGGAAALLAAGVGLVIAGGRVGRRPTP